MLFLCYDAGKRNGTVVEGCKNPRMKRLAIVEDVDTLREVLCAVLDAHGYETVGFCDVESALKQCRESSFDCILCDYKLPQRTGLDFLLDLRERSVTTPFIIMTAYGNVELAVEAMKNGANDFLTKPFDPDALISSVEQVINHRRIVDRGARGGSSSGREILFASSCMKQLLQDAVKVARVDTSVLLLGESGTGKELVARHIHANSPRANKPFVAVNCGAIPPELMESELFGHESGSFTGATQTRIGVFELASEGTLFLDEVGDMPLPLQVKLLRVLQERELKRVGGTKVIKINPRIVAATNHSVDELLTNGIIREDFYYRIAVVTLRLSPLRERKGDIDILTDEFLRYFSKQFHKDLTISPEARNMLRRYQWPGNVREIENVLERASLLADRCIEELDLGISLRPSFEAMQESIEGLSSISGKASRKAEAELISRTLMEAGGNKSLAARKLKVSYKTLLNKVRQYELS